MCGSRWRKHGEKRFASHMKCTGALYVSRRRWLHHGNRRCFIFYHRNEKSRCGFRNRELSAFDVFFLGKKRRSTKVQQSTTRYKQMAIALKNRKVRNRGSTFSYFNNSKLRKCAQLPPPHISLETLLDPTPPTRTQRGAQTVLKSLDLWLWGGS